MTTVVFKTYGVGRGVSRSVELHECMRAEYVYTLETTSRHQHQRDLERHKVIHTMQDIRFASTFVYDLFQPSDRHPVASSMFLFVGSEHSTAGLRS